MKLKDYISSASSRVLSSPLVKYLLSFISSLEERLLEKEAKIEALEAEIRVLKSLPKKPNIEASNLDKTPDEETRKLAGQSKKRPGSDKRKKKETLEIHEHIKIELEDIPIGWQLVGYKQRIIQDMIVRSNNIAYDLEIWRSPDGLEQRIASLPSYLTKKQFGANLEGYVLHQYYHCGVTQPLIHQTLCDYGVDISVGQINNILIENKALFHEEKKSLLATGITLCKEEGKELRTDDTGAKHEFKKGYCNCINNDLFTYFTTTSSKSRINFLEILRLDRTDYYLNEAAISYLKAEELPPKYLNALELELAKCIDLSGVDYVCFSDSEALNDYFQIKGFTAKYAIKTMTEAMLIGSLVQHGFDTNTLIHSDGAGQFNVFVHSLCWKHAERPLLKIKTYTSEQQNLLEEKKKAFWLLYQSLKKYKKQPNEALILVLENQFDQICELTNDFLALDKILVELKTKKEQLLRVLYRPQTSLHNNASERDIREYVKRRKISAGTRSEKGKMARDTFLSLKKTCQKLGISFWIYLLDRLQNLDNIPPLANVMKLKAKEGFG